MRVHMTKTRSATCTGILLAASASYTKSCDRLKMLTEGLNHVSAQVHIFQKRLP